MSNQVAKSESIMKLAEALSKAQGEFGHVKKDSLNPFFKSKYADLASILEAVRPALAKHGLSHVQLAGANAEGDAVVSTYLLHSSGEFISGELSLPVTKADAQGFGSALTYARRYGLQAILGVAAEDDDDGNGAVDTDGSGRAAKFEKKAAEEMRGLEVIKQFQVNAFVSACATSNRTKDEIAAFLKNLKHKKPEEILKSEFDMAIKWAVAPQRVNGGSVSKCHAHGEYSGDGNCPQCELGITARDIA